jgi:hypothetical protein
LSDVALPLPSSVMPLSRQPMTQTMYYVIGKNNLQFGLLYSEK